ncbi:hypothetical protein HDU83_005821 [Entophlyctis luteolus]|nr:hypothetical protein HDU83_005821 [Entophlyctis luteolus]
MRPAALPLSRPLGGPVRVSRGCVAAPALVSLQLQQSRHVASLNKALLLGVVASDPVFAPLSNSQDGTESSDPDAAPRRPGVWSFSVGTSSQSRDRATGEWKNDIQWHQIKHFTADSDWKYAQKSVARGAVVLVEGKIRHTKNPETEKWYTNAAKIIESFIVPKSSGVDQIIPPQVIANAKGIAILSVIKAGFLFSGRGGSGIVLARLSDGCKFSGCITNHVCLYKQTPALAAWSAPSAIGTAGFGAGGQIGVEITDFVIILNTADAVKAFSHGGNVTLGGNLSVAAGPVGRNAEASGSILNLAPIYSYSVTKGLFVGISLEGSVIIERKETNATFYRRKVTAKEILSGSVPPPPAAEDLYRALNRRTEDEVANAANYTGPSNPMLAKLTTFGRKDASGGRYSSNSHTSPNDTDYRTPPFGNSRISSPVGSTTSGIGSVAYGRTAFPTPASAAGLDRVTAMYDFDGQREGDLSFRTGDTITVLQKNANDWWVGRIGGREGVFPANYVQ